MVTRYILFKNILKFDFWWLNKNKPAASLNKSILFSWGNNYILPKSPLVYFFVSTFNVFYKVIQNKGSILFFLPFLSNNYFNNYESKSFFLYKKNIYMVDFWVNGLVTNFSRLRWWILGNSGYFLRDTTPDFIISLGDLDARPAIEAESAGLPSIGFSEVVTYNYWGSNPSVDSNYFFFSFYLSLFNVMKLKRA
jgi:hypothetical protein